MASALTHREQRIVGAVVPLLLPEYPRLDAAARATVTAEVIAFVAAQIRRLPDFLRLPYRAALLAFAASAAARHRRPFQTLAPSEQAAWLARWSDGPLGPTRNFVKLLRSCALLAYFDHPVVRAALEVERAPSPARIDADGAAAASGS